MLNFRKVKIFSLILFLLLGRTVMSQTQIEPVNKNATPEAKALLNYLYSVSGKKIISGHHNYNEQMNKYSDRVYELTGEHPAIWGSDFFHFEKNNNGENIVKEAYKKYQDGYIVTLMWHVGRPQDDPPYGWKESVQAEMTDAEWKELTTPGTNLYKRWEEKADIIAGYLAELRDLGVPVLWRPYHEMNGIWFWWGDKKGTNGYQKLWKMMYDRFVNHHKLNNLIWVWNTNTPRELKDDEAYAYKLYYPGHDYVDVLAADVYHNDYKQSHHDQLVKLAEGRVISLGEVGEVPTPEILANQPMWTWFMIWTSWVDTHNTPEKIKTLYNNERVLKYGDVEIKKDIEQK